MGDERHDGRHLSAIRRQARRLQAERQQQGLPPDPRYGPAIEDRKPVVKAEKPRPVAADPYAEEEERFWDFRAEVYRQQQRDKNECSCDYQGGPSKRRYRYGQRLNLPITRTWTDPKCVIHGTDAAP